MKSKILGLLAVGLLVGPVTTDAAVMNFDSIPNGNVQCPPGGTCNFSIWGSPYYEGDSESDSFGVQGERLTSWDSGNDFYTGSKALFESGGRTVTLWRYGGGAFSLLSIDLEDLYNLGSGVSVTLTGTLSNGTTLTSVFNTDGLFGYQTFAFSGWSDLVRVTWAGYVQFDNIVLRPDSTVPELVPLPATAWLLLSGLAGLGAMVRRKTH